MNCENCGTKIRNGICTNCHEELYINDYQMPEEPMPVSKEWMKIVEQQRKDIPPKFKKIFKKNFRDLLA